jgi:hypothetical protein
MRGHCLAVSSGSDAWRKSFVLDPNGVARCVACHGGEREDLQGAFFKH